MAIILVLSDESDSTSVLPESLEKLRHKIVEVHSVEEVLQRSTQANIDVLFIDGRAQNESLLSTLAALKEARDLASIPFVVVTAQAKSDEVIEVMKLGAFDHLSAPVSMQELDSVVNRAIAKPRQNEVVNESRPLDDFLVGHSSAMRHVEKLIGMAAMSDATVLITGETGTGKDTVGRTIHRYGKHRDQPLTVIDCTAVPEDYGSFQSLSEGSRGTVILDEIGDLNAQMQAMLVRALKETPLNATNDAVLAPRIIATTQYDLINMVKERRFREDLFYRLNVLSIKLPPLRERGSDVLALAETFLQQANPEMPKRLSSSAVKLMLDYEWPGNVRELENLMYHLTVIVRSSVIAEGDVSMLSHSTPEATANEELDYYSAVATLEKRLLIRALKEANGSRAEAARLLGINRQLLYSKLKTYGLEDRT